MHFWFNNGHQDREIIRDFIKAHCRFLKVHSILKRAFLPTILFSGSVLNIVLSVCLIQMHSVKRLELSEASRSMVQCLVILLMSFTQYLASETLDSGNDILYKALITNQWYNVRPDIRKLLLPILCVVQKPKRFMYFGGTLDLSFPRFFQLLKFSYSSFTLLKHLVYQK
ncbi:hypothetical protein WDU94_009925 [Cyamophila willieti]